MKSTGIDMAAPLALLGIVTAAAAFSAVGVDRARLAAEWLVNTPGRLGGARETAPVRPVIIAINGRTMRWYSNERVFANLMIGGYWQMQPPGGRWVELDKSLILPTGDLKSMPPDGQPVRMLTRPNTGLDGAMIRCTYRGKGELGVQSAGAPISAITSRPGQIEFRWINRWIDDAVFLRVHGLDPVDPIRQIDCRETTMPIDVRFDPAFVRSMEGYPVMRFMQWQDVTSNAEVTWPTRHTPATIDIASTDGVSIEDIVAFSNAIHADPWVCVPWNASPDYVARFAKAMHDGIPPGRSIYVELSNEVWNRGYAVSRQATAEGLATKLAADPVEATLNRYAQKTIEVMKIWETVFSDRPGQLVRVVASQHGVPARSEMIMRYPGLATHVDALATAPYFGFDVMKEGQTEDLDEIFARLASRADAAIATAAEDRQIATRYRKRFIAYEAGQHVLLPNNIPLLQRIQRDPRMYDIYKRYIRGWRTQIGDVLAIYTTTGPAAPSGAFGLVEHSGQRESEAPKLRAVIEERHRSADSQ